MGQPNPTVGPARALISNRLEDNSKQNVCETQLTAISVKHTDDDDERKQCGGHALNTKRDPCILKEQSAKKGCKPTC